MVYVTNMRKSLFSPCLSNYFCFLFQFIYFFPCIFELHTKRKPMRTCSLWSVAKGNCTNTTTVLFGCIRSDCA